ncbi:putative transcriptional regulatory protein [Cladobotryum mycophilum]|uniref:Transcriptional regulatory protein n=1 Tax=Cladobotryum mycophilum TaxID=491253 RepID=A0ABR0SR79_9HYPO
MFAQSMAGSATGQTSRLPEVTEQCQTRCNDSPDGMSLTFVTDDLPPEALVQRLLDIFLDRHHAVELCGCLHKDDMKSDIHADNNRFLLYSILALSGLYLTDREATQDRRFASAKSLSQHYLLKARSASRQTSDQPSVTSIQANLCLGLRELLTASAARAWMHVGLAIRMAQALRLRMEYNQRHAPRQREVRRRTFWACVVLDRLVAYCTFRTQTIDTSLVKIHLPCSDVAFAFGHDIPGPQFQDLGVAVGEGGELRVQPYFIKTLILWGNIASDHVDRGRRNFELSPYDPLSENWKNESIMKQWCSSLPGELRWSEENLRAHQSLGQALFFVQMHFLIVHASFLVHHEYLPQIEESESAGRYPHSVKTDQAGIPFTEADSRIILTCLDGARQLVNMIRLLVTHGWELSDLHLSVCIGMPIVTAASVLLWAIHCSQCTAPIDASQINIYEARHDVNLLLSTLESLAQHWELAQAWATAVKLLDKFYLAKYSGINDSMGTSVPATTTEPRLNVNTNADSDPKSAPPHRLLDGDGLPDITMIPQALYYKVRLITGLAMELPELLYQNLLRRQDYEPLQMPDQQPLDLWDFDSSFLWLTDLDLPADPSLWAEFAPSAGSSNF